MFSLELFGFFRGEGIAVLLTRSFIHERLIVQLLVKKQITGMFFFSFFFGVVLDRIV